jgi:hypothetical protein
MSQTLRCPACHSTTTAVPEPEGDFVKCPYCGGAIPLSAVADPAASAPLTLPHEEEIRLLPEPEEPPPTPITIDPPTPPPAPEPEEEVRLEVVPSDTAAFEVLPDDAPPARPTVPELEPGYGEAPRRLRKPKRERTRREPPRSTLPEHLRQRLEQHLQPGERILWCGRPAADVPLVRSLFVLIPAGVVLLAGLIWLLFGLARIGTHRFSSVDVCFSLFLIVLSAAGGLLGFHWLWSALYTCYAVTDRRALIWRRAWTGGPPRLEEYLPDGLGQMTTREKTARTGDLVFQTVVEQYTYTQAGQVRTTERTREYGFLGIDRVREIETLVRETLLGPPDAAAGGMG